MNPEDFSRTVPESVNEKPFRAGGHWDELSMKKPHPVEEDEEG